MIVLLFLSSVAIATCLGACQIVYNVFFHPLRKFPGPLLAGATPLWKAYKEVLKQETLAKVLFELHEQHGKLHPILIERLGVLI